MHMASAVNQLGVVYYSGNTLAAWAELVAPQESLHMLASAQQAYEAALTQESDAAVYRTTCMHMLLLFRI